MTERNTSSSTAAEPAITGVSHQRPNDIPEKFWDTENGKLRVDALMKSYRALEKRLSQMPSMADTVAPQSPVSMGRPASPDDYQIIVSEGLFEPDPEINQQLFDAGFTQAQAQLVYDLAVTELLPIAREISELYRSELEQERLVSYFGGQDRWREASRQIRKWGRSQLPTDTFEALASSYEGILAMHKMMGQADEPSGFRDGEASSGFGEGDLRQIMRSPRYWKDRDPGVISKVADGFRRLYS